MRLVCISDTHKEHWSLKVPEGDILVHAGDVSGSGSVSQLEDFFVWFRGLPHRHKVVVAGNHDFLFERNNAIARDMARDVVYLQDDAITIEGLKFYGSPWQPWFLDWAFNLPRGQALKKKWEMIPTDTDVLVTHAPPQNVGDLTSEGESAGCADLLDAVLRIKPKVHVYGHIHEGYGIQRREDSPTTFINASVCTASYAPVNKPIVVDL